MRLAVISDIHGNLEAFGQVLADIDRSEVDKVACLGDNVGYGPDPEGVVNLVRERRIPCVLGNHELAMLGRLDLSWYNEEAARALVITQRLISPETVRYMDSLENVMFFQGSRCVHGCPPDSATTYLFEMSSEELKRLFKQMDERICFVGHTHDLRIICFDGASVARKPLKKGLFHMAAGLRYIINVGSVGQPRDGHNNAKYVIWDDSLDTIEVRFVSYDISVTAGKILKLGLPPFLAMRLF